MLKHIPFYASLLDRVLVDGTKATSSFVLVYGAIEAHAMGEKGCIAGNATIAAETGLTQNSVATIISRLNKAGWVKVNLGKNNTRLSIDPLMDIKPPFDTHQTPLKPPSNIEYIENTVRDSSKELKQDLESKRVNKSNPDITDLVEAVKSEFGIESLDDTQKNNRIMASHMLKKFGSLEKCLEIVSAASASDWWSSRVTKVSTLYYNGESILRSKTDSSRPGIYNPYEEEARLAAQKGLQP